MPRKKGWEERKEGWDKQMQGEYTGGMIPIPLGNYLYEVVT